MNKYIKIILLSALMTGCDLATTSSLFNSSIISDTTSIINSSSSETSSSKIYITSSSIDSSKYSSVTKDEFYKNYIETDCYEDSQLRTENGLISGSIEKHNEVPKSNTIFDNRESLRFTNASYHYDSNDKALAYDINTKDGVYKTIYYNAGYITLEEVAAYTLAFGEVPANYYDKDNKALAIAKWKQFGRINISTFSNNKTKYPHEPELPVADSKGRFYKYTETDIGLQVGFRMSNGDYVGEYNNGNSIARGVCRLVYTSSYADGGKIKDINERHVFYTYNHYNDFQEYLNYYGGWSNRFGNESSGNPYCGSAKQYNSLSNPNKPTSYIESIYVDKNTLN